MGENEFIQWSIVQRTLQELVEYGVAGFESKQELPPLYLYFLWIIRKISCVTSSNLPHVGSLYLSIFRGISDGFVVGSFAVLTRSYVPALLLGLLLSVSPEYAAHAAKLGNLGLSITLMHIATAFFLLVIRFRRNWLAMLAVFCAWAAVQIHISCFFPAISLILLLLLLDFTHLTYQQLIKRSSVSIFSIFILYLPYLFFPDAFLNEEVISYQENIRHFFSFLFMENSDMLQSVHILEKLGAFLGISAVPLQYSTFLTGFLLFIALLRAILYHDKIAQLFLYSLFGTLLVYSFSREFDATPTLLHLLLPVFLFVLSLVFSLSKTLYLCAAWGGIALVIFFFPLLYAERKQKFTMPEYDVFRKVALEVVEKGLLVKGFDGVESLQHAKPHHIGYMLGFLGGKLDQCAKETVIAREDGSFFLLEEKGPSFPQSGDI